MITKLSRSVIRTTHLTGMVTDIGIALGRIVSIRISGAGTGIASELAVLQLLSSLVVLFFLGGVIGALGFRHVGFYFTLPLSAALLVLASMPIVEDMRKGFRRP